MWEVRQVILMSSQVDLRGSAVSRKNSITWHLESMNMTNKHTSCGLLPLYLCVDVRVDVSKCVTAMVCVICFLSQKWIFLWVSLPSQAETRSSSVPSQTLPIPLLSSRAFFWPIISQASDHATAEHPITASFTKNKSHFLSQTTTLLR